MTAKKKTLQKHLKAVLAAWIIDAKCLIGRELLLRLFSPNLIDQSSCRILTAHALHR